MIKGRLTSPSVIKDLATRHGFRFERGLGQNFLIDYNLLQKIVMAAEVGPRDLVLEVGPGFGTVTQALLPRAGRVLAVELDRRLAPILAETLGDPPNLRLYFGDVLEAPLPQLLEEEEVRLKEEAGGELAVPPLPSPEAGSGSVNGAEMGRLAADQSPPQGVQPIVRKAVANLPYYITTPVLTRLLEPELKLERIVVMVQWEVAQRLLARPGTPEYGSLTVFVNFLARASLITRVPRTAFLPPPEVDSAVLLLRTIAPPADLDLATFSRVVRAAFGQRRKTLLRALAGGLGLDRATIEERLALLGMDWKRRGETLSQEEFLALTRVLRDLLEKTPE